MINFTSGAMLTNIQFGASDRKIKRKLRKEKRAAKREHNKQPHVQQDRMVKRAKMKTYATDYTGMNMAILLPTAAGVILLSPWAIIPGGLAFVAANAVKSAADEGKEVDYWFNSSNRAENAADEIQNNYDRISAEIKAKKENKKGFKDLFSMPKFNLPKVGKKADVPDTPDVHGGSESMDFDLGGMDLD